MTTEPVELDLTDFMPKSIRMRLGEDRVVEISSDQKPGTISRANAWLRDYLAGNDDVTKQVNEDEGWEILNLICGQDMHEIGTLGMVRVLSFFQDTTLVSLQKIFSASRYGSVGSSTEDSPSETSSEVLSSSEPPSTS